VVEPMQDRIHLQPGKRPVYTSYPPTSGPHDAVPLPAGWLSAPLTEDPAGAGTNSWARAVHSLEHGYVVVLRGSLPKQDTERLQALVTGRPKVIVAPDPRTGAGVTLLAWTVRVHCDELVPSSVQSFLARHVAGGNAPEPDGP
jgi:hypothetical protein